MPQAALNQAPNPTQTDDSFGSSLPQQDSCLSTYLVCLPDEAAKKMEVPRGLCFSARKIYRGRQFVNDRFGVHQRNPHWSLEERWKSFDRTGALRPCLTYPGCFYKMIGPRLKKVSTKWSDQLWKLKKKNSYKCSFPNKPGPMPTKWLSYLQNEGIQGKRFLRKRPLEISSKDHVISHSVVEISRG